MTLSHPATRIVGLFPILTAFMSLMLSVGSVDAADPIKLGLAPVGLAGANFVLTMQPGESRDLAVLLTNFAAEPLRARIFAADAYSMVNGGFAARLDGEPTGGTTSWLKFPGEDLDLGAGVPVVRRFTVAVPKATPPGEYLTTIVLQNADAAASDASTAGGMMMKQIVRQIVAVSVDVPGTRTPALEIGPMTQSVVSERSTISIAVNNLGNIRLTPRGEFVLWDSVGAEISRFPIVMDIVYAHTDTFAEVPFSQRLNPGNYVGEVSLTDVNGLSVTSQKLLLTIPIPIPDSAGGSPQATAPLAQSNQIPIAMDGSTNTWLLVAVAFGAGLGLMLAGGWLVFIIHRRRTKARN